jgi:hypothetical protein
MEHPAARCLRAGPIGMRRFEYGGNYHQERRDSIGPDDLRRVQHKPIRQPKKNAGQIESQHGIGKIISPLPLDLNNLGDVSTCGAHTRYSSNKGQKLHRVSGMNSGPILTDVFSKLYGLVLDFRIILHVKNRE